MPASTHPRSTRRPGVRPSLAALCVLLAMAPGLGGCDTAPLRAGAQDLAQQFKAMVRKRGERQVQDADTTAQELGCARRGAAPLRLESAEVLPQRPRPGREINQRIVYAACPAPADGWTGVWVRRLVADGRTVLEDREPALLKPGRWSVDVFIGIPPQATPGPYRLETRFERRGLNAEVAGDFTIVAP